MSIVMLSKDLQNILEGVHYFLSDALASEELSGKSEGLRRALVLQLEGLVTIYPTLSFKTSSSTEQTGPPLRDSWNSLSAGSNFSSSGSSGDGVTGSNQWSKDSSRVEEENIYEEFDKRSMNTPDPTKPIFNFGKDGGGNKDVTQDEREDLDDVYMEAAEKISFSSIALQCDKQGPLSKKTKQLMKSLKQYQCVLVNNCIYLYVRENDDKQQKTIDLTNYEARSYKGDEIKQPKKDSAFEITAPGRKTHIFVAKNPRERDSWISVMNQHRKRALNNTSRFVEPTRPKLPPPPISFNNHVYNNFAEDNSDHQQPEIDSRQCGLSTFYTCELKQDMVGSVVGDELYEEILDEIQNNNIINNNSFLPSPPPPSATFFSPTGTSPSLVRAIPAIVEKSSPKTPPKRPPLPRDKSQEAVPETPTEECDVYYSVINEDESKPSFMDSPPQKSPPPLPARSLDCDEMYDVPSELERPVFKNPPETSVLAPPVVPPKGLPVKLLPPTESEYKVPNPIIREESYQVPPPPNPIQAEKKSEFNNKTNNVVNNLNSEILSRTKRTLKAEEPNAPKSNNNNSKNRIELGGSGWSTDEKIISGSSVKDRIAMLNQAKSRETNENKFSKVSTENKVTTSNSSPGLTVKPVYTPKPVSFTTNKSTTSDLDSPPPDSPPPPPPTQDTKEGVLYEAKFAFVATISEALNFSKGDVLLVTNTDSESGWWEAEFKGKTGVVPKEYLKKKET